MQSEKWKSRVSEPTHQMQVDHGVMLAARDGTLLACDVYRPRINLSVVAQLVIARSRYPLERAARTQSPLLALSQPIGVVSTVPQYRVRRAHVRVEAARRRHATVVSVILTPACEAFGD